jgi:hypothetical protein
MVDKNIKDLSESESLIWSKFTHMARYRGYKVKDYLMDLLEVELEKFENKK